MESLRKLCFTIESLRRLKRAKDDHRKTIRRIPRRELNSVGSYIGP